MKLTVSKNLAREYHLNDHGILGEKMIVAHAINVNVRNVELLVISRTWVTHQSRLNLDNGAGLLNCHPIQVGGEQGTGVI